MKNKKMPIIALALIAIVGIVGGTIAYFTSSAEFPNIFKTKTYNTELTEEFKSPSDWTPGTKTDKLVQVKNTGNIDVATRVSYTEEWIAADGTTKPSTTITVEGEEQRTVLLHIVEEENWIKEGNYYYYNKGLTTGESATFIDYVTFNPNVEIEYDTVTEYYYEGETTPVTTPVEGKKLVKQVKKYTSKEDGYAGATYTLTIKVETVQLDKYKEAWETAVEIA